jgi:hypothetical protein
VADRVGQAALNLVLVLEPIPEADFVPVSYGFGRCCGHRTRSPRSTGSAPREFAQPQGDELGQPLVGQMRHNWEAINNGGQSRSCRCAGHADADADAAKSANEASE